MRTCGILLPVSSLPSRYGIGSFSKEAYGFVDQLARAGQTYWQILPLGPTGYGDSPYQSFSAFAGNPYFIDLETLAEEGLLIGKNLRTLILEQMRKTSITQSFIRTAFRCCGRHTSGRIWKMMSSFADSVRSRMPGFRIIACIWQ